MEDNFYKKPRWISKREKILKRDEYMCRECKRYGKTTGANTVHHIYPLKQRPDLAFNSNNLLSLCSKCHDRMHDRSNNELTELGVSWVNRLKGNIPPGV